MKSSLINKIRNIREIHGFSRSHLALLTGISESTIKMSEQRGTTPSGNFLSKFCKMFPQYTLWLMTNEININIGQISPQVTAIWHEYCLEKYSSEEWLYYYGEDESKYSELELKELEKSLVDVEFDRTNAKHLLLLAELHNDHSHEIHDAEDSTSSIGQGRNYTKNCRERVARLSKIIDKISERVKEGNLSYDELKVIYNEEMNNT